MPVYDQMLKRQQVLADFGEFALRSDNLDEVLTEACRLVGEALGTHRAKILEIQRGEECLLVRAGVGWDPGIVGQLRLPMSERSSETFSIKKGKPVITQDIRKEERFEVPAFMRRAGVIALANVPIFVPGQKAYGLLQVDATEPRDFGQEDIEFLRTYATILGPVIDRLQKVGNLRASEERFRLVVENARDYAIFTTDPQDRITDWYHGAQAVFGWSAEEIIGQPAAIIFTTEDRQAGEDAKETEIAVREGSAPNVRWHVRKDGSRVFIEGMTTALCRPDGSLKGFLKIGQDVTGRREAETALRESEERFRSFAETSADTLWIVKAETGQLEYLSPAFEEMWGEPREGVMADLGRWLELVHPEDRKRASQGMPRVLSGDRFINEYRIVRPSDGTVRWIHDTGFPIRNERGEVWRAGGIAQDVTDQKETEARLEILVKELQHRSRNLLGLVTALANRTIGRGAPVESFTTRLKALSRAQALLSQSGSDAVEVRALVNAEFAAHLGGPGGRITISGPEVQLTSTQVQTFALALHELTTNAVKYGALKGEVGRLSVAWELLPSDDGGKRLALSWVESGVDVRPEMVSRRGYGRELIEQALAYALQARTEFVLGGDGVRCRIELPIA
ncbi:PAS domain S-box protein [Methylobacterium sp. ID0610]|uniref:PAS domain S-box protein n=1 Tax=Methylobacterium carpenticola TaxID=3344827 RepID=UPI00367F982C